MEKVGIICEYNPFHNGHIYHLQRIKDMFPDSFITLVMSSSFTERGEASFLKLGMDYLVFGSETNDIDIFKSLARCILYNKEYDILVKKFLDLGNSYPASVSKALYDLTGTKLEYSNDILAISYIKTIMLNNYKIKPLTLKRTNEYLNQELSELISSATSIRKAYLEKVDITNYVPKETKDLLTIPRNYLDNYFLLLKYKLISEIDELDTYYDVTEGIDKKIKKVIYQVNSYQELIDSIKSKRYTYTRLNRMFLHILTNLKENPKDIPINYLRVLGFDLEGREYLKKIKGNLDIPIITNYKDIDDEVLDIELKTTILYLSIMKFDDLIKEELKSIPIQVKD